MCETEAVQTRRVRVSYVPTGFGLALAISDDPCTDGSSSEGSSSDGTSGEGTGNQYRSDGLLRIGDSCVTLELPTIDGRTSILAWDPAEVTWESMVA